MWVPTRVRKTSPDYPTARCSCVRDTNVNQTPQAEKMSGKRRIQKPSLGGEANLPIIDPLDKGRG